MIRFSRTDALLPEFQLVIKIYVHSLSKMINCRLLLHYELNILLGLIIILLGNKHTTLHMSVVRARPLNMLSQKLFPPNFDTSEAEGLEREEIPYIGCGSCP